MYIDNWISQLNSDSRVLDGSGGMNTFRSNRWTARLKCFKLIPTSAFRQFSIGGAFFVRFQRFVGHACWIIIRSDLYVLIPRHSFERYLCFVGTLQI